MKGMRFTLSIIKQQAHDSPQVLLRGWNHLFSTKDGAQHSLWCKKESKPQLKRYSSGDRAGQGTGGCTLWIATSM